MTTPGAVRESAFRIRLGPLRHEYRAPDRWGRSTIARMAKVIRAAPFGGTAGRVTHLQRRALEPVDVASVAAGRLPRFLEAVVQRKLPAGGWTAESDTRGGLLFFHPGSRHAFWIRDALPAGPDPGSWLPWSLIAADIIGRGGGLIHAGLARHGRKASLFYAPPGGGKTTTLARFPGNGEVLGDDAALVWKGRGGFRASPLPTFGALLRGKAAELPPVLSAEGTRIGGICVLRKSPRSRLVPLAADEAARFLYRALSEHPGVVKGRDPHRIRLFRLACAMARKIPAWRLETSREGGMESTLADLADAL